MIPHAVAVVSRFSDVNGKEATVEGGPCSDRRPCGRVRKFNTEFASGESRIPMSENGVEWGE
jgi:hypothetical protein